MAGTADPWTAARDERRSVAATVAVSAASWLLLGWLSRTSARSLLHHHALTSSAGGVDQAVFALGWLVMVGAMMLPPSMRFVLTLRRLLGSRRYGGLLVLAGIGAFATVWVFVGQLFQIGDLGVHALVNASPWLRARPYLVTAGALALAGAYQLAPLKLRCLRACRNPAGFVARAWHGRSPGMDVLRIGTAYGWSCVGCCWAMMLLMFAAGLTSLALMAVLAAAMLAERHVPRIGLGVHAVGAALVVASVLIAARLVPPFGAT